MAKIYDNLMRDAEEKGLRDWRKQLLQHALGDVLELGCGTGANLEFYPEAVKKLVLVEPSIHMRKKLQMKISKSNMYANVEVLSDKAERLSFSDERFDVVVCTLVLCTVKDLDKTLSEIYRVLKPEGKLLFIEHVAATNNSSRYKWQRRLAFLWKCLAAGCCLTRQTEKAIIQSGFNIVEIERQSMRGVPTVVRPSIRGIAIKNSHRGVK